jgi:cytochrome c oxidase assembly protein subunit 15
VTHPHLEDVRDRASRWRHRWSAATLVCTLVLIFVGGLVTSTDSALAVPDWPLSYGQLMPPMVGGIFYEHGHRMVASFVGFLTLVLAIWIGIREPRRGVRRLGWLALGVVCVQGLLGGLTVLFFTPLPISVAHACLAQTFLCLMVALTYSTSREWTDAGEPDVEDGSGLRPASVLTAAGVFVQLVLGAIMRHAEAGLAIPDFPLAFGQLVPPLRTPEIAIHFAHRVGAVMVTVLIARLVWRAFRDGDPRFSRPGLALAALTIAQLTLGASVVLTRMAVYPTTTHVVVGAAILATSVFVALRAHRLRRPPLAGLAPVDAALVSR